MLANLVDQHWFLHSLVAFEHFVAIDRELELDLLVLWLLYLLEERADFVISILG